MIFRLFLVAIGIAVAFGILVSTSALMSPGDDAGNLENNGNANGINISSTDISFNLTGSPNDQRLPKVNDANLKVELVVEGLATPSSMVFIDEKILVLQKDSGKVRLVSNGGLQTDPILDVFVNKQSERGLLGVAVMNRTADIATNATGESPFVFVYYTENVGEDVRNRVYRYDLQEDKLVNPVLVLDLPGTPGPNHDGGKLAVNNSHLFAVIGDLNRDGQLQNFKDGAGPDDTSVVLRVDHEGKALPDNPFVQNGSNGDDPVNRYYAYGIRNSFGMDFDPVTGTLWMTENGPSNYDEINIVYPGFNGGWQQILGPIERSDKSESDLVQITGSKYYDAVFSWHNAEGITDIEFLNSSKLGEKYHNNIFVGDINNGNLYFFKVNENRDGLDLSTLNLEDRVADEPGELFSVIFGTGFAGITDIETGPDGNLYILSFSGKIYRIMPSD